MQAIFFEEHGSIDVLQFGDLPTPEPRQGEALIRVRAVALNHIDIEVRRGWLGLNVQMPHVTGSDIAGEVVRVHAADSEWTAGRKVIVYPGVNTVVDEWTQRGDHSVSPGYQVIGETIRGGMAEYVAVLVLTVRITNAEGKVVSRGEVQVKVRS